MIKEFALIVAIVFNSVLLSVATDHGAVLYDTFPYHVHFFVLSFVSFLSSAAC